MFGLRKSQIVFLASILFTSSTVYGVHLLQQMERKALRAGIIREDEKILSNSRKQSNIEELRKQNELEAKLKKEQFIEKI